MNVEDRKQLLQDEKQEYEIFLSYIPMIKEIIVQFNGKVMNKKFEKALKEKLERYVSCKFDSMGLQISLYSQTLKGNYSYYLPCDVLERTESEKYRLKAKTACRRLEESGKKLTDKINTYNADIDFIRKEFKEVIRAYDGFMKKYDSRVLEIAGCSFDIRSSYMSDYGLILND